MLNYVNRQKTFLETIYNAVTALILHWIYFNISHFFYLNIYI